VAEWTDTASGHRDGASQPAEDTCGGGSERVGALLRRLRDAAAAHDND
jgi:hypothetical protein